ncbi:MAG TPA: FN3 domain-containing metallophosphoesterase family protein [Kiritimatiellia bacterium]|nr:FN3 domain-containing metallophosphoesterase family protein [Kiritimatiellia bacterium]
MSLLHRRAFLKSSLLATLAAQTKGMAAESPQTAPNSPAVSPILTPPSLQIPAPTSMGIVWGVTTRATGFVDWATRPDFSDARRVFAGSTGLRTLDDAALGVRLTGLAPDSVYHYRTGTVPIDFRGPYKILPGEPVLSDAYSFRTPGMRSPSSFAVINDTHENHKAFALLAAKLKELNPAVTVWNGDLCDWLDQMPKMLQTLLNPGKSAFAVSRPFLFTPGNHDYRGLLARELPRLLLTREPTERASAYWTLERNYAYRQGEIALIGLDTGEDKPDGHPAWGQLAQFTPYRELQAKWLADTLERPEIKSAPYLVAFCHIPLFDDSPKANPGDRLDGWASWQRHCHDLWSPLFERYGLQLVITAHTHRFRFDAPTAKRSWAHMVGGAGCDVPPKGQLTVLEGRVIGDRLKLTAHNLTDGSTLGEHTFAPRQV